MLTARRLQKVFDDVCEYVGIPTGEPASPKGRGLTLVHAAETAPVRRGWFSGLFAAGGAAERPPVPAPRGLYMYGGVGVGKTMLMDLFASVAPPEFQLQRIHFHDFMIDVHTRLRHHSRTSDPLRLVADEICGQTKVRGKDVWNLRKDLEKDDAVTKSTKSLSLSLELPIPPFPIHLRCCAWTSCL